MNRTPTPESARNLLWYNAIIYALHVKTFLDVNGAPRVRGPWS